MIKSFLAIASVFLIFDYIWIYLINRKVWHEQIKSIQCDNKEVVYRTSGAIFVYSIMVLATFYLVIQPTKKYMAGASRRELIIHSGTMGAILGLAMYGVFDGTNYVLFKDYKLSVAIQDVIYGVFVTSIASIAGTLM